MTDTQTQYLARLAEISVLASAYQVDLSQVTFSDASRVVYFLSSEPGSLTLVPRLVKLLQLNFANGEWEQVDMDMPAIGTLRFLAWRTGQMLHESLPPSPPQPVEADPSPLRNTTGRYIGTELAGQPGCFALLASLPVGIQHTENGSTYLIESVMTAFGPSLRARKVA